MEPSPSNKSNNVKVALTALLKSPHALLGVFAVIALVGLWFSLQTRFPLGEYLCSFLLFVVIVIPTIRFGLKGPESDRFQPSVSLTHQDNRLQAQFVNVEMTGQVTTMLHAIINRHPLPPPAAIIEGSASDPTAFREVTPEVAEQLRVQDAELVGPAKQLRIEPGEDPEEALRKRIGAG